VDGRVKPGHDEYILTFMFGARRNPIDMSPTGPWGAPTPEPTKPPPRPPYRVTGNRRRYLSVAFFVLMVLGVGIRAYKDLSRPEAWAYWKELYFSPSMQSSLIADAKLDGSRPAGPHWRSAARSARPPRAGSATGSMKPI
jgi:hypothetical protein